MVLLMLIDFSEDDQQARCKLCFGMAHKDLCTHYFSNEPKVMLMTSMAFNVTVLDETNRIRYCVMVTNLVKRAYTNLVNGSYGEKKDRAILIW